MWRVALDMITAFIDADARGAESWAWAILKAEKARIVICCVDLDSIWVFHSVMYNKGGGKSED
jgi:hypothetical protein